MLDKDFDILRAEVRGADLKFGYQHTSVPCCYALEAFTPSYPCPVGFVWYHTQDDGNISVDYMFVHDQLRRQGIMRRLLEKLVKDCSDCKYLTTGRGSEDLGEGFLKYEGWTQIDGKYWQKRVR